MEEEDALFPYYSESGELTLIQLGSHLRIKESIRTQEIDNNPKGKNQVGSSSVNMVEGESSKNPKKSNGKRKFKGEDDKFSNKKAKLVCWNCNKLGHFKKDFRLRKVNKDGAGPSGSKDPEKQQGATSHVCKDLYWFKDFQPIEDGSIVKMGNVATEPINDIGSVLLTFTSGKFLCLNNVLYVPGILYFESTGIIHQTTAPYTPQQIGVAERKNRILKEMVNSMLSYFGLSEGFWGETMLTTCYILNRTPNKRSKNTPYELWCKKVPNLSYLKVWGCRAVVRLTKPKRKTLDERGIDYIFIGYDEHSKAYIFYVLESNDSVSVNNIIKLRDAIFDEERFTSIPRPRDIIQQSFSKNTTKVGDDFGGTSSMPELRKSTRARKAKSFGSNFQLYLVEGTRDEIMS
uniref:Integrase catalytic domain-containing protein n=1 Tax=Lactuca sativa TaxID=4236 RepID=A0A9R1WAH3_LACSA|nr:hypothetical protein LSAT_V11C300123560 [Lactuca sativa]